MLWLADKDYSTELEKLRNMSRGYINPRGEKVAKFIEDLFSKCTGDKFDYISPHFMDGAYTPEELRTYITKREEE